MSPIEIPDDVSKLSNLAAKVQGLELRDLMALLVMSQAQADPLTATARNRAWLRDYASLVWMIVDEVMAERERSRSKAV